MSESSPGLLGTMGYISGLTAIGIAGTTLFKEGQYYAGKGYVRDKVNIVEKVAKSVELSPLVGTGGFNGKQSPSVFMPSEIYKMKEHVGSIMGDEALKEHEGFFKEFENIDAIMKSKKSSYSYQVFREAGDNISINMLVGKNSYKMGSLTRGFYYPRTEVGLSYAVAPKFTDNRFLSDVIEGRIKTAGDLKGRFLSANEFIAKGFATILEAEGNPEAAYRYVQKSLTTVRNANKSNMVAKAKGNSIYAQVHRPRL